MKFLIYIVVFLSLISLDYSPSLACHDANCPHTETDTGIHWSRSLKFTYQGQKFNLIENHEQMSKRAEKREKDEDLSFLNVALCNIQFVYKDGDSLKLSSSFEIQGSDIEGKNKPFFSNLALDQSTRRNYVKFPQKPLEIKTYTVAVELLESILGLPLAKYVEVDKERESLIEFLRDKTQESYNKSEGKKRKREHTEGNQHYNELVENLEQNRVKVAEKTFNKLGSSSSALNENTKAKLSDYFEKYKILKAELKNDINSHIITSKNTLLGKRLFGNQEFENKISDLKKRYSIHGHITSIQSLMTDCEAKLGQIEQDFNENPLSYSWRRLEAPKRDFKRKTYLPFNREKMIDELGTEEKSYLQHSEQLVLHYINSQFTQIQQEINSFYDGQVLQNKEIRGAFFNLFSTRDMCERCAICLSVDHACKNGFAQKLLKNIRTHNKNNDTKPFIVYAVSSRLPYATPIGSEKINSREYYKSVDTRSNSEQGRNVIELSKAHISLQTAFFSHETKEITEEELNKMNKELKDL